MQEELILLIRRHTPELQAEVVHCNCGNNYWSNDGWSRHLAEEIELYFGMKRTVAAGQ